MHRLLTNSYYTGDALSGMLHHEFDRLMAAETDELERLTTHRDRLEHEQDRRLCSQAFFTKVYIDEVDQLRVENNRPFEMLLGPEINANVLNWTQNSNKARTPANDSVGKGSSLVRGVDLCSSLSNPREPLGSLISRVLRGSGLVGRGACSDRR